MPDIFRRLTDKISEARARKEEQKRMKEAEARAVKLRRDETNQAYQKILSRIQHGDITSLIGEENGREILDRPDEEHTVLTLDGITFLEPRAVQRGRHSGHRIRITTGWYYYTGGSQSEATSELREIDRGSLRITTRRVRFEGTQFVKEIKLSEIESMTYYDDAFGIAKVGREKLMYFAGVDDNRISINIENRVYEIPCTGTLVTSAINALQTLNSDY
jgi:hypothetical protein